MICTIRFAVCNSFSLNITKNTRVLVIVIVCKIHQVTWHHCVLHLHYLLQSDWTTDDIWSKFHWVPKFYCRLNAQRFSGSDFVVVGEKHQGNFSVCCIMPVLEFFDTLHFLACISFKNCVMRGLFLFKADMKLFACGFLQTKMPNRTASRTASRAATELQEINCNRFTAPLGSHSLVASRLLCIMCST